MDFDSINTILYVLSARECLYVNTHPVFESYTDCKFGYSYTASPNKFEVKLTKS